MRLSFLSGLALASSLTASSSLAAGYADAVTAYNPGQGFATEFSTGRGYTNTTAVLGPPSRVTPGQFGGPVDPFSPPYLSEQLLSLGTGGSLTVQFNNPIVDDPTHPFGLDFIIFGSAGFVITNGDFAGGGVTDGTLFGVNPGATRVSVSSDNVTYYELTPSLAPIVDGPFPTDGLGDLSQPLNPSLIGASFAGRNLAGIRTLYGGSGGGAGYDISWARQANGQALDLPSIRFIRVDVLSGASEIDGFAAVPEPTATLLGVSGMALLWSGTRIRLRQKRGSPAAPGLDRV